MIGVTFSTEDLKAAPPEVRRWLAGQIVRPANEEPMPEAATRPPTPPRLRFGMAEANGSTNSPVNNANGRAGLRQNDEATKNATIHKLIAERAYELWENQGRPDGSDLIHWRVAEQQVKGRPEHGPVPYDGDVRTVGNL